METEAYWRMKNSRVCCSRVHDKYAALERRKRQNCVGLRKSKILQKLIGKPVAIKYAILMRLCGMVGQEGFTMIRVPLSRMIRILPTGLQKLSIAEDMIIAGTYTRGLDDIAAVAAACRCQ